MKWRTFASWVFYTVVIFCVMYWAIKEENPSSGDISSVSQAEMGQGNTANTYDTGFEEDLTDKTFVFAVDNTKSMQGYATSITFQKLIECLENNLPKKTTTKAVLRPNDKSEKIHWEKYDGTISSEVMNLDSEYYCHGKYKDEKAGPISLLKNGINSVGAFEKDSVTVIVTDFQEQGNRLSLTAKEIRDEYISKQGNEEDYSAVILGFRLPFSGSSIITNYYDEKNPLSQEMNGEHDQKPLYVVIIGKYDAVGSYANIVKRELTEQEIGFEQADNIKIFDKESSILDLEESPFASSEEIDKYPNEYALGYYLNRSITGLDKVDGSIDKLKEKYLLENDLNQNEVLLYNATNRPINYSKEFNKFNGFWNWSASYRSLIEFNDKNTPVRCEVKCNGFSLYEFRDKWVEIPIKEAIEGDSKYLDIEYGGGVLKVSGIGKNTGAKKNYRQSTFKVIFHMEGKINRKVSINWIKDYDLQWNVIADKTRTSSYSFKEINKMAIDEGWHYKTLDLEDTCKELLCKKDNNQLTEYDKTYNYDLEVIFFKVSNV